MRRWSVGINNYYFTSSICLDEAPWYVFVIEHMIQVICTWFPWFPLPKIKIIRDGEETTLKEWYGTTRDLFHIFVCTPITDWCFKKTKMILISHPYEVLKKEFPKDFELVEKDADFFNYDDIEYFHENKQYSETVGENFMEAYRKLENISKDRGCPV
jgi:hypothetical protein